MDNKIMKVSCNHEKGNTSIVCGHHLYSSQPVGFVENSSEPQDLQGWCFACEYMFEKEGEMTEKFKAFSDPKVVCEMCYHDIKNNHSIN